MSNKKFFALVMFMAAIVFAVSGCGSSGGNIGVTNPTNPAPEPQSNDVTPKSPDVVIPDNPNNNIPASNDVVNPVPDNPVTPSGFTVAFDSMGGDDIASQVIQSGGTASEPVNPRKEGNTFLGWYTSEGFSFTFRFDTPISRDIVLYAKWWDNNDTTDTDGDGLIDSLEYSFGTDPNNPDTDDDGLTDWEELNWLNYNPLAKDTDGNGVNDGDEDADGDGLANNVEGNYGSNMILSDTDHDGLSDYEEVQIGTLPDNPDTDGDGVNDGTEIRIGSDPLNAETIFATSVSTDRIANGTGSVDIAVKMNSSADAAGTLTVRQAERSDNVLVSQWIPGFLDAAYQIESGASFDSAKIEFSVSSAFGEETDLFKPRIYTLDDETGIVTELENQKYENGKIIAQVSHFSIYILLNKVEFDSVWDSTIRPPSEIGNTGNASLDMVFVIDYSASMINNDSTQMFKTLCKNFVSKLRDGQDKAAVVKFIRVAETVSGLTADKDALNEAIDSIIYDSGYGMYSGTNGSAGLSSALDILEDSSAEYKCVVFMTDGEDNYFSYPYDDLIQRAKDKSVTVFTIGMGNAQEETLKKVADETSGQYFYASVAEQGLEKIFNNIIGGTIDYVTDTNGDGISDYYTRLLATGGMRIQNGTANLARIAFLSNDPELSKDWDGDGLLNSEEIEIRGGVYAPYAFMKSNPLNEDSDGDGFTDYEEVKNMHSSPLKYTKMFAEPFKGLRSDTLFPPKYVEFSKEPHESYLKGFDCKLDEWAQNTIIDYFTEYSTDIALDTKIETSDVYYNIFNALEAHLEAASQFLALAESIGGMMNALDGLDSSIAKSAEVMEARSRLENLRTKAAASTGRVKLAALVDMQRQKNVLQNIKKDIEEAMKNYQPFCETGEALSDELDFIMEINEEFQATEATVKALLAARGLQLVGNAVSISTMALQAGTAVAKIPQVTNKIPLNFAFLGKAAPVGKTLSNLLEKGEVIGNVATIALDAASTVKDVIGVFKTYSKIKANYAEFTKYTDLLLYISRNANYPYYVRNAAWGLYETFGKTEAPQWEKLNIQVMGLLGDTLAVNAFDLAFDVLVLVPGPQQPVMIAAHAIRAVMKALCKFGGFEDKAEVIVKSHVYYAVADGSNNLLGKFVKYAGDSQEYIEFPADMEEDFNKYTIQLAQGRLLGLSTIMEYIVDGSLAGFWDRGSHFWDLFGNDQAKKQEYSASFQRSIDFVHSVMKILGLKLSPALP